MVFFAILCFFLVRRSLSSWADGAAVVAAQSVSEEAVYTGRMGEVLPLSQSAARESVGGFVVRHGLGAADIRFDAVSVVVERRGARAQIEHVEDAWRPGWG